MEQGPASAPADVRELDVVDVRWPAEAARRAERQRARLPTLLVVEVGTVPPDTHSVLEDWTWSATPEDDRAVRRRALARRVASVRGQHPPVLVGATLHHRGAMVVLEATVATVLEPLVRQFNRVVPDRPGAPPVASLTAANDAVIDLGLRVRRIAGSGSILERTDLVECCGASVDRGGRRRPRRP